jgi:hypothetical protein
VLQRGAENVLVTAGEHGVWGVQKDAEWHLPALPVEVRDVTGAGDAFSAGVITGLMRAPQDLQAAAQRGLQLAALTLQSEQTVAGHLHPTIFDEEKMQHPIYSFSKKCAQAMAEGRPVVALESTIISHGMPYPQNVQTAREVEQIIREHGAVPATIAIMNGKIHIGLSDADLELLGQSRDAMKVSRRDLPYVMVKKLGATTVAATMICAELANIPVFVTGGIGGVHRGAETSLIFLPICRSWRAPR